MKLEQQVVSLEISKKLVKLLGDKAPDSLFSYFDKHNSKGLILTENTNKVLPVYSIYPAYTVSELGELLPYSILEKSNALNVEYKLAIWKLKTGWSVYYGGNDFCLTDIKDKNQANAMAKMLIYLIENKLNK